MPVGWAFGPPPPPQVQMWTRPACLLVMWLFLVHFEFTVRVCVYVGGGAFKVR